MACYHPSKVDVLRQAASDGARRPDAVTVPCGSCLGCRMDQAASWAVRMCHEAEFPRLQPDGRTPRYSWFATLTYSPENLPEHGSVVPEDFRAFVARLRRGFPRGSIQFYGCGEYGETSFRPHYHAVLFGPAFLDRDLHCRRNGAPVWISKAVQAAWGVGVTELTPFTPATARYTAGYVRKKVRRKDDPGYYDRVVPETGEIVTLESEFSRMSRRPALGRRWIERFWSDVYPRDFVLLEGRPRKPPRYYDKWMEKYQPLLMEEVREQRWKDAVEIGDEKLIMKEKVHRARIGLFNRRRKV